MIYLKYFTVEMFGEEGEALRAAGGEYGAATGRPRRVGAFDAVASRYGVRVQGCDEVALTKLDVLSYLDKIPVCTAYTVNGKETKEFPFAAELSLAKTRDFLKSLLLYKFPLKFVDFW